jgi:hypothetical protein
MNRNPWKGWKKEQPNVKQRKKMSLVCGKKCFLGKNKYPICTKNTCRINHKGVYSAYIRASQYKSRRGNKSIIKKAKKIL